jgi:hypothetical protein
MATTTTMRDKVSELIGDYFKSTTTSDGSGVNDLIDTELKKYDDDEWVDKYNTSVLIEGAVTAQGEENFVTSKSTSTLTLRGDWSALIPNNTLYSVHKLFTAAEKDRAIERMRTSLFPTLFLEAQYEFTTVADQYTYDISSASFEDANGAPREVLLVDTQDTERTQPLTHWEIVPGQTNKFRFKTLPAAGRTIRLIGIKTPALSDLDTQDEDLLAIFACRELFNAGIQRAPGDVAGRSNTARDYWTAEANRILGTKKIPPAIRKPLGYELAQHDVSFLTP